MQDPNTSHAPLRLLMNSTGIVLLNLLIVCPSSIRTNTPELPGNIRPEASCHEDSHSPGYFDLLWGTCPVEVLTRMNGTHSVGKNTMCSCGELPTEKPASLNGYAGWQRRFQPRPPE